MTKINKGISAPQWCRGCGKKIHTEDPRIARIGIGQLLSLNKGKEKFDEDTSAMWGYMHEHCFLLAVGDPALIRRQISPMINLTPSAQTT